MVNKATKNRFNIWLLILITAFTIDLVMPLYLATFYPDYSHLTDTISTLGTTISSVKTWAGWSLIMVGILYSIFSFGQYELFEKKGKFEKRYALGILFFGIGSILAGIFPEDHKGLSVETINGKIHGIASFIGFVGLILCPYWATKINQIRTIRKWNYTLFVISIFTFLLFLFSENIDHGFLKNTGLFQRVNLLFLYAAVLINYWNSLRLTTGDNNHCKG